MRILLSSFFLIFLLPASFLFGQSYKELVEQSAEFIENNQLDSAAASLQRAMSLEPTNESNPVLLLNLGILQRQLRLFDDAYVSFTASMANSPMPDLVLHNRASLLCDMERYDEAMEDYNLIIHRYPGDAEAYYRRGLLYLEQHDRTKAEADFTMSEQIDPDNLYTKLSRALRYKLDDNWVAAEKVYTDLIQSEQHVDPSFYLNRAECYVNTDQIFKASADLRAIEDTQKNNPYFYFLRGRVRYEQFDKVAASADFKKAKVLGYDGVFVDEWLKKTEK
ncbi:MAG TPA: hypothetical protein DDX07_04455 [Porphyromonadaceae bacterium]|jgi:tetratricopeptide (TPR) repeat protein|nr:hypothetical protein [Porphyromonadaceae bacterium]